MALTIDGLLRPFRTIRWSLRRTRHPGRVEWNQRAADAEALIAAFPPDSAPIRPVTRGEFEEMTRAYPYYETRWRYTSIALAEAVTLIRDRGLRNALEMGAPVQPIIVGADVMDIKARPELHADVSITIHDATVTPWPVGDKQYDLFLALQVFEHLGDRQPQAFLEVRRIARHAIISLPIDWVMSDPENCHHQIPQERVLSWFAPVVPTRILVGNRGKRRRHIFVFEDLPAPDGPAPAAGASDRPASAVDAPAATPEGSPPTP